jgi:uncharacterized protein YbgA (DUF1722 family)
VQIGLSVPRPTLRLERHGDDLRLVMPQTGRNLTRKMRSYARAKVAGMAKEGLSGFILKSNSPSCGLRTRAYTPRGRRAKSAAGLFAEVLLDRLPNLPVIEESQFHDQRLRQNWIQRVFVYCRLHGLWSTRWRIADLVAFHTAHKYLLLAHSPKAYRDLGRMVAGSKATPRAQLRREYEGQLFSALAKPATPARHVNVLHHMLGFFKKDVDRCIREELLQQIDDYRRGLVPLLVPLTLIRHYVRLLGIDYLEGQVYLHSHPDELALQSDA